MKKYSCCATVLLQWRGHSISGLELYARSNRAVLLTDIPWLLMILLFLFLCVSAFDADVRTPRCSKQLPFQRASTWLPTEQPASLPMRGGKETPAWKKKVCLGDGCPNKVVARGLCGRHGGRKPCALDGCTDNALARGFCGKHGGLDTCSARGCTTNAQKKGGHCRRHGGVHGFCTVVGCKTSAIAGGTACAKHGANGGCTVDKCTRNARQGKKVCFVHSTDRAVCSAAGCGSYAHARGLCKKHGGRKICSADGCGTAARARGLCHSHGAYGFCTVGNCTTAVQTRGRCRLHGGGSRKMCSVTDCPSLAAARSLCAKHGAQKKRADKDLASWALLALASVDTLSATSTSAATPPSRKA